MKESFGQRNLGLEVLKIALAIMVVGIHTDPFRDISPTLSDFTTQGFFRLAVPVFFVINGFYFKSIDSWAGFRIWLSKNAMLYVIWMLVYSPFWLSSSLARMASSWLLGYHHLWYMSALMVAGGMLFVLRDLPKAWLGAFAFLLAAVGTIVQYVGAYQLLSDPTIKTWLAFPASHRNALFTAFPFMTIGYLLACAPPPREWSKWLYSGLIMALLCLFAEVLTNHLLAHDYSYDNLAALILVCPLLFLCVLNSQQVTSVRWLSIVSADLYFIHPLFIKAFAFVTAKKAPSWLTFAVVISGSLIACFCLHHIRLLLKRRRHNVGTSTS